MDPKKLFVIVVFQEVPQLLLGTTREKAKPTNLVSYKSENFELVFAQEGGRVVGFKDLKYNKQLITEEEKRLNLFPLLTYKSTLSMMKLSKLAPKMQQLKEKYKDDPVKFQEEMVKLYSEAGFNPASGCLPILLQIPVFFALYKVLTITADLQLAKFLWISSLAEKDPFYILPVLMGITMIAQQFISPSPEKSQNYYDVYIGGCVHLPLRQLSPPVWCSTGPLTTS
jgi:YidC/Oxa1 family membrane protein insertase